MAELDNLTTDGRVAEQADALGLNPGGATHGGSIPLAPTITLGQQYLDEVERWARSGDTRHSTAAYHIRNLLKELRQQRRQVYLLAREPLRRS